MAEKHTFALRFKQGPNPAETRQITASSLEVAERAGRLWCERQGDGLRPWRFINVRPVIEFDADEYLAPPVPEEPKPVVPVTVAQPLRPAVRA